MFGETNETIENLRKDLEIPCLATIENDAKKMLNESEGIEVRKPEFDPVLRNYFANKVDSLLIGNKNNNVYCLGDWQSSRHTFGQSSPIIVESVEKLIRQGHYEDIIGDFDADNMMLYMLSTNNARTIAERVNKYRGAIQNRERVISNLKDIQRGSFLQSAQLILDNIMVLTDNEKRDIKRLFESRHHEFLTTTLKVLIYCKERPRSRKYKELSIEAKTVFKKFILLNRKLGFEFEITTDLNPYARARLVDSFSSQQIYALARHIYKPSAERIKEILKSDENNGVDILNPIASAFRDCKNNETLETFF